MAVRGGVEPPTFRFSGGFSSPRGSTTRRLTRPYDVRAVLGVQDQPHVSTAVVSTVLADGFFVPKPNQPQFVSWGRPGSAAWIGRSSP